MRIGTQFSTFSTQVIHEAECPKIAPPQCMEYEIEPHLHDQGIHFFQLQTNASFSIQKGLQLSLNLPFDIKYLTIAYRKLEDDSPYDPPYAGIHHRNETLVGLGDGTVSMEYFLQKGSFTLGLGLGSSIPLGRTEENPYQLGIQGKEHQHFQMGTGVFAPIISLTSLWTKQRWGIVTDIRGQWSVYENAKSYRPPHNLNGGIGPWWAIKPRLRIMGQLRGQYESREEWSGVASPNSGKKALGLAGALMWKLKPDWEIMFRTERNIIQNVLEEAEEYQNDQIPPAFISTIGLTWWR